jgi:hypothetical protein
MKWFKFLFVFLVMMMFAPSCSQTQYDKLAWGFRSLEWSAQLAEGFDGALKVFLAKEHDRCLVHGAKTPEFVKCIDPALAISRAWTGEVNGKDSGKGVLPALQSGQRVARLSLNAAYDYLKSKDGKCDVKTDPTCAKAMGDWKVLFMPVACAAIELVDRAFKLGVYTSVLMDPAYQAVKAFTDNSCAK